MILYFLVYYGILFVLNSFLVYKRTGKNPYLLGQSKGVIGYVEKSIKTVGMIIPVVLVIFEISRTVYMWLVPISYLEGKAVDCLGVAVMILGLVVCLITQYYMRSSRKIGIDLNTEVKLVTEGIFRHSRNPFFIGTILSSMGFFLVLPNILTFTSGVVYVFLIQIQVRLEEDTLAKSAGNAYLNYCAKVRRWV